MTNKKKNITTMLKTIPREISLNPVTLSFKDECQCLEQIFVNDYNTKSLRHIRISLFLGLIFYAVFGFLDASLVPEQKTQLWFIRYAVVCPCIFISILLSFIPGFKKYIQACLFFLMLFAGSGISIMVAIANPPANYSYYAGVILVFMMSYGFIKARFIWACLTGWINVFIYEIVAVWIVQTPGDILLNNNFFFISANVIGMFICYSIELSARKNFFMDLQLEFTQNKTITLNQNLEKRVRERTADINQTNAYLKKEIAAHMREKEERKRTEKELMESEEKFRLAFLTSPDSININRIKDGTYLEINEGFTKIMGYSREDTINKSSIELNIWKNKEDRNNLRAELEEKGLVENFEAEFIAKDGSIKFGLMSARIIKIKNEDLILSITHDITEKKQIEDQIKKSEERYREFFEEDLSGSYISTPEGQLIACNKKYLKIFGFKNTQEAFKMPITKIFETSEEGTVFLQTIIREKKIINRESQFQKLDGTHLNLVGNASGVFNKNGELENIRGFILDVTEQRRLESQIIQSQKMETIGTLAGGIAHDFNNILFPIVGHSEMLLDDVADDSPLKEGLNEIYTSALRAKELVNQILTFSRREKNELKLFKIQPILKEALKLIRATIPTTIEIVQEIQPDCGVINADPTQIHQVIMNLTTNAFHALEKTGGTLSVTLKEIELNDSELINPDMAPGFFACLTVEDDGIGMAKSVLDKIFDPFYTTKENGKGTGIGLSMVHGIIKNLNGGIQVISQPNQGTKFCVYIPVQRKTWVEEKQEKNSILGGTEHILLIDDEKSIVKMVSQMLERFGYTITTHTSSVEALEIFRNNHALFDLVITDLAMPKLSGTGLAKELVAIRPDIPILLCTGFSDSVSREEAFSMGIIDLLMKPIVMDDMAQKIRDILDKQSFHR